MTTFAGAYGTGGIVDGTGSAARFVHPSGMKFDAQGTLFVADQGNGVGSIRKISPSGVVTTFASGGLLSIPSDVAFDASGNVFVANFGANNHLKCTAAGECSVYAGNTTGTPGSADGPASNALFSNPTSVLWDPLDGGLFVADKHSIRKISAAGVVSIFAGTGEAGYQDGPAS